MDQLPRLGKRELICLLLFTCNYVVSVWRGFLFLLVLGMGYVILLWHSLSLHIIILTNDTTGTSGSPNDTIDAISFSSLVPLVAKNSNDSRLTKEL